MTNDTRYALLLQYDEMTGDFRANSMQGMDASSLLSQDAHRGGLRRWKVQHLFHRPALYMQPVDCRVVRMMFVFQWVITCDMWRRMYHYFKRTGREEEIDEWIICSTSAILSGYSGYTTTVQPLHPLTIQYHLLIIDIRYRLETLSIIIIW